MTSESAEVTIMEVSGEGRLHLQPILEESFTGWYRQHAMRTLRRIEVVRAAFVEGGPVGVVMLSWLNARAGYVYYIAVLERFRGRGVGGRLLDHSLESFFRLGAVEVYASVTGEDEAVELFRSRGFRETSFKELTQKYGAMHAMDLYRRMLVVPGETLLVRLV